MIIDAFYIVLGQLLVIIAIIIVILFIIVFIFGKYLVKIEGNYFPKFILLIVDSLYSPFKTISKVLKMDEHFIDNIAI